MPTCTVVLQVFLSFFKGYSSTFNPGHFSALHNVSAQVMNIITNSRCVLEHCVLWPAAAVITTLNVDNVG